VGYHCQDSIDVTTRHNRPGIEFADMAGVHAPTDVIGLAQAAAIGELADGPVEVSVV
jgi:selenophosphate synthase